MKGHRAAVRYAKSLMQLSSEKSLLNDIKADMDIILNAINDSKELENFLNSPLIKIDKKKSILESIFKGKVNELSMNFIMQVANQKREALLKTICQEFIKQYNQMFNIAKVELTTAKAINKDQRKKVMDFIQSNYKYNSVEMNETVDEDLIGGIILRIEDRQIDGSIKRKLQDIKKELIQA